MASQQILFAETIAGMKKAFKRKAYDSDSDSEIDTYGNRGHKLKKRARFAHQGQLLPTTGPSAYKEYVEYAGVRRAIIHRNPPLVDDEGYEVDSEEDDDRHHEAEMAASESNPYANIQLETLLAPLTASTALSTHPTLSKPFTSKTLTRLVDQSCDIMRKENGSLWEVRHLLTSLCGDYTWVPCEMMVRSSDAELYTDDHVARHLLTLSKGQSWLPNGNPHQQNGVESDTTLQETSGEAAQADKDVADDADITMTDADTTIGDDSRLEDKEESKPQEGQNATKDDVNEADPKVDALEETKEVAGENVNNVSNPETDKAQATPVQPADHGPSIEGQAATELIDPAGSIASQPLGQSFVHPMFIAPSGTKPDRDVGLPEQEAEDIRRLLALYVQKQEEVCRGARKLFLGLLRAEKLRKDVLHWSKAEAHSGPNRDMSDGEDWYDKEEWGLTEDLKKGQDEEEEDTQTTGKKTRNRRNN